MFKSLFALSIIAYLLSAVLAASSSNTQPWNKRPRQFRMQVYSRPDHKGEVQTLRTSNGGKYETFTYKQPYLT